MKRRAPNKNNIKSHPPEIKITSYTNYGNVIPSDFKDVIPYNSFIAKPIDDVYRMEKDRIESPISIKRSFESRFEKIDNTPIDDEENYESVSLYCSEVDILNSFNETDADKGKYDTEIPLIILGKTLKNGL